jgi:hypothetical protein
VLAIEHRAVHRCDQPTAQGCSAFSPTSDNSSLDGSRSKERFSSVRLPVDSNVAFSAAIFRRKQGDQHKDDNNIREPAMGLQEQKIESLPFVTAELNYLAPTPGKPRTYALDPPPGEPKSTALPEPHAVPVFDARPIAKDLSLDREGFVLVRHPTVVKNFYDEREIRSVYYPAVEAFLRATLNADRVFIFDHTVRKRVEGAADVRDGGPRQPATRVHVDQTGVSGRNRVYEHLPNEADELLKGRVQVINLWRPIRGPVLDAPLAMVDGRTVDPDDLVASDLIYPNRKGETYSVRYNPAHRWYYVSRMTADEALLLKCYDSVTDGRTRFGPHTAFIDPTAPADAAPRESIEVRTLVFHEH